MFVQRTVVSRVTPQCLLVARMCSNRGEGAIRAAGGAFSKMEAAHEEEYFRKKQYEAIQKLKSDQIHQVEFHEMQIKEHEAAIQRHKEFLKNVSKKP